jgi:hypothetical protein
MALDERVEVIEWVSNPETWGASPFTMFVKGEDFSSTCGTRSRGIKTRTLGRHKGAAPQFKTQPEGASLGGLAICC